MSQRSKPQQLARALRPIVAWLWDRAFSLRLRRQVHVSTAGGACGELTSISIDDRLPPGVGPRGWRVQTGETFLPAAHFTSEARHRIRYAAQKGRGRAIYCVDLGLNEVVAAAAYHIHSDPDHPLLLTALAVRCDASPESTLLDRSLTGALVLKRYLHEIARQIGRGGCVDADVGGKEEVARMRAFGFRNAPKVKGFRAGAEHLRQDHPPR